MERDDLDNPAGLIELGSVSGETKGDPGVYWEASGLSDRPTLSDG